MSYNQSLSNYDVQWEVVLFEAANFLSTAAMALLAWRFYKGSSARHFSDSFLASVTAACLIRCMWVAVWDQVAGDRMVVLFDAFLNAMLASSALGLLVRNKKAMLAAAVTVSTKAAEAEEHEASNRRCSSFVENIKRLPFLSAYFLILLSLILAYFLNPGENAAEYFPQTMVAWACYLDAAALAPQLWHLLKWSGDDDKILEEDAAALPGYAVGLLCSKLARVGFWAHMFRIDDMRCFYCLFTADCIGLAITFAICGLGVVRPWMARNQSGEIRGLLDAGGMAMELPGKAKAMEAFDV